MTKPDIQMMNVPSGYKSLADVFQLAINRASLGKGVKRHADYAGQPFEKQDICDELRGTDKSAAIFQIRKKAKESLRLPSKQQKINELLDTMVYAAGAIIVLLEEMEELDSRNRELKETKETNQTT